MFVVYKTVNYEVEVFGVFDSLDLANELVEQLGPSSYIKEHKLNTLDLGGFRNN